MAGAFVHIQISAIENCLANKPKFGVDHGANWEVRALSIMG